MHMPARLSRVVVTELQFDEGMSPRHPAGIFCFLQSKNPNSGLRLFTIRPVCAQRPYDALCTLTPAMPGTGILGRAPCHTCGQEPARCQLRPWAGCMHSGIVQSPKSGKSPRVYQLTSRLKIWSISIRKNKSNEVLAHITTQTSFQTLTQWEKQAESRLAWPGVKGKGKGCTCW